MKGYFYTILIASVCGAICSMMAWGGFEKYIKYIASLVCAALIIAPFRGIDIPYMLDTAGDNIDSELDVSVPELYESASDMAEKRAEEYISQIVFSQFGINAVSTDIKIDWDKEEPIIESIFVTFDSKDMNEAESAREYLMRVLGGEVTVVEG